MNPEMVVFLLVVIPMAVGFFLSLIIKIEEGIKDESYL
jgi:hypothetical protein